MTNKVHKNQTSHGLLCHRWTFIPKKQNTVLMRTSIEIVGFDYGIFINRSFTLFRDPEGHPDLTIHTRPGSFDTPELVQ